MECIRLGRRHDDLLKLERDPWCVSLHPSDDETHISPDPVAMVQELSYVEGYASHAMFQPAASRHVTQNTYNLPGAWGSQPQGVPGGHQPYQQHDYSGFCGGMTGHPQQGSPVGTVSSGGGSSGWASPGLYSVPGTGGGGGTHRLHGMQDEWGFSVAGPQPTLQMPPNQNSPSATGPVQGYQPYRSPGMEHHMGQAPNNPLGHYAGMSGGGVSTPQPCSQSPLPSSSSAGSMQPSTHSPSPSGGMGHPGPGPHHGAPGQQGLARQNSRPPYDWMKKQSYQSMPIAAGKTRTKDKYRIVYSEYQKVELEKEYLYSKYITIQRKAELSRSIGLSERQVKIWFQNRRAKERKQKRKREEALSTSDTSTDGKPVLPIDIKTESVHQDSNAHMHAHAH